ncbi:MAG: formate dehydrogenase accessory sulfurtransferase FdhD, partial [Verrucomicrobiia bacterium]
RHVFASSSCGLCGKATIDAIRQQFPAVEKTVKPSAELIASLPDKLREAQKVFSSTGGLHAAALFDADGELIVVREDVGRHNAVDKVIGHGFLGGNFPYPACILLISGRASFEIMQKTLAAGIPVVAAVSAPSNLAVDFARENNQTLVGFLREGRMNVYAGEIG